MTKGVPGFDYLAGKTVRLAPVEWRDKYPPSAYRREAKDGETAYHTRYDPSRKDSHGAIVQPRCVAEAYAIIPAGKSVTPGA